jgi:hypothetical protein
MITRNIIRCLHCGSVCESKHVHDYVSCACGKVAADGGHEYLKRTFTTSPEIDYQELSETTGDDSTAIWLILPWAPVRGLRQGE